MKPILPLLCLLPSLLCAQTKTTPSHVSQRDWSTAAKVITANCHTQREKAKAIYNWLGKNIAYDVSYTIYDADQCMKKQRGVCQAYCELFWYIAKAAQLEADIVVGISKDPNGDTAGHSWITANVEEGRILIDPTWGAGGINDGNFIKNPNDNWFDVPPHLMILSHHPADPSFQLLARPISLAEFILLTPPPHPNITQMGVDPEKLYTLACDKSVDLFVDVFDTEAKKLKILDIPLTRTLRVGQYYTFDIVIPDRRWQIATWTGSNTITTPFKFRGDTAVAHIMPSMSGPLRIILRRDDDERYATFLEYTVAEPTGAEIELQEKADPLASGLLQTLANYNQQIMRQYNVDGKALLEAVKSGKCNSLPVFYNPAAFNLDLMEFPYASTLDAGKEYTITLRPHAEGEWAVICGTTGHTDWQTNQDQSITIRFKPQAGKLAQLAFKAIGEERYKVCLAYECK